MKTMTTTTTTTAVVVTVPAAIAIVATTELNRAEEMFYFVMDKKNGITVPMLDAALVDLGVVFKKKDTKETKASFFARALEMDIVEYRETLKEEETEVPAAGETPVAEPKLEEETVMKKNVVLQENIVTGAEKRLPSPSVPNRKALGIYHEEAPHALNKPRLEMLEKVNVAKNKYLKNLGEHEVEVCGILFYPEKGEATRDEIRRRKVVSTNKFGTTFLGEVTVKVPEDFMQIKTFDRTKMNARGELGSPAWVPFEHYNVNLVEKRYTIFNRLTEGEGYLVLPIRESADGKPEVRLPVDHNDGQFFPFFATSDYRYIKTKDAERVDEPLFLPDNNRNVEAALNAFIQVFSGEFVQENPENRNGYNESCFTCRNAVVLNTRDGVMDDVDTESRKTRSVLEQIDTTQLSLVGSAQPTLLCMVKSEFVDIEGVDAINAHEQFERTYYTAEDGSDRFQAHDEILIAGKPMKKRDVKLEYTKKTCEACPFYHANNPKGEIAIGAERTEKREAKENDYVSAYFKTRARAGRMPIQTLTEVDGHETWVTKFPGEVENPFAYRVKGIGVTVTGSDAIMAVTDPDYIADREEFDAANAKVMKQINQIYYVAFNLDKVTQEQFDIACSLADLPPSDLTENQVQKWEKAAKWLEKAIGWAQEREEARKVLPFAQKFFTSYVEGAAPLMIEDIMGDTLYRNETNQLGYGLGYDDLLGHEFTRYLDESAENIVYSVLESGVSFYLEGGREKDRQLASEALQELLQRELNFTFIRGVRRDENPVEAINNWHVSDEVKEYMRLVVGLGKK